MFSVNEQGPNKPHDGRSPDASRSPDSRSTEDKPYPQPLRSIQIQRGLAFASPKANRLIAIQNP